MPRQSQDRPCGIIAFNRKLHLVKLANEPQTAIKDAAQSRKETDERKLSLARLGFEGLSIELMPDAQRHERQKHLVRLAIRDQIHLANCVRDSGPENVVVRRVVEVLGISVLE